MGRPWSQAIFALRHGSHATDLTGIACSIICLQRNLNGKNRKLLRVTCPFGSGEKRSSSREDPLRGSTPTIIYLALPLLLFSFSFSFCHHLVVVPQCDCEHANASHLMPCLMLEMGGSVGLLSRGKIVVMVEMEGRRRSDFSSKSLLEIYIGGLH